MQVAKKLGLSKFVYLAKKSMLHHTLRTIGPITIFIPSNKALDKYLKTEYGKRAFNNNYALRMFLLVHIFGGRWPKLFIKDRRRLENFLPGALREVNMKFYDKVSIDSYNFRLSFTFTRFLSYYLLFLPELPVSPYHIILCPFYVP